MWTPAGYMKANKTEYRVYADNNKGEPPMLLMCTWEKARAEELKKLLHGRSLVLIKIEEVEL